MRLNWIDALPEAARTAMTEAMIRRRFAAGALIYSRSEPAAGLYIIRSGVALFYLSGETGRQLLLKIVQPNGILGGSVSYDGRPALLLAEARTPLETDLIPTARLVRLRQEHPEIDAAFAQIIARNLRLVFDLLEEQALLDLRQRALRRLDFLADDIGEPIDHGTALRLRITQSEFAAMVGASRQAVNAVLCELEKGGLIKRRFGSIDMRKIA